jgi:hypothetical protein
MLDPYTAEKGPKIVAAGTVLTGHGDPGRGGAAETARLARRAGPS